MRSSSRDTEQDIQAKIRLHLGQRPDLRLFRNNVGEGWQGQSRRLPDGSVLLVNPRRIQFGLHTGSPDLVGLRQITITPEMVGRSVAVFVGIEVKSKRGKPSDEQAPFLAMLQAFGALAGVARSAEDAERIIVMDRIAQSAGFDGIG